MPQKLWDADGNEIEVPTDEEIKALSDKVKELETVNSDLTADEGNRNWKQMRESFKTLRQALKEKGVDTDESGKVINQPPAITPEDVDKMVAEKVNKTIIDRELNRALSKYDAEQQKVVRHYFDKITAGEELSAENVEKYIIGAARAAMPEASMTDIQKAVNSSHSGGVPTADPENKTNFAETEEGKGLAAELGMTLEAPANK